MPDKKTFRHPFWALVGLIVLVSGYYFYSIFFLINNNRVPPGFIKTLAWQFSLTVALLSVECFIYWKFQKRIVIKWWALIHVILVYFALVGSPILFAIGIYLISIQSAEQEYINFIAQLRSFRMIFYWFCLFVGHIFFMATIVKALSSKNITGNPTNESSDILDEFVA